MGADNPSSPEKREAAAQITSYRQLQEAMQHGRPFPKVRFTIPPDEWGAEIVEALGGGKLKPEGDMPDESGRTSVGHLELASSDFPEIKSLEIINCKPLPSHPGWLGFYVPVFREGEDERVRRWKMSFVNEK